MAEECSTVIDKLAAILTRARAQRAEQVRVVLRARDHTAITIRILDHATGGADSAQDTQRRRDRKPLLNLPPGAVDGNPPVIDLAFARNHARDARTIRVRIIVGLGGFWGGKA